MIPISLIIILYQLKVLINCVESFFTFAHNTCTVLVPSNECYQVTRADAPNQQTIRNSCCGWSALRVQKHEDSQLMAC